MESPVNAVWGSKYNLKNKIVGILGLSFKAQTDYIRDSISIKKI